MSSSLPTNNSQTKRKEIYKYEAPWMVYAMNWSIRPDKRFRLALGSFIEEYNNKVNTSLFDQQVCKEDFRCKLFPWKKKHQNLLQDHYLIILIPQRK